MKRYGEFEQINGAVANGMMDEIYELKKLLVLSLKALDVAGLQGSIENHLVVENTRVMLRNRFG